MFDRVRPIVLYCHRLQRIKKRIVVQAVHLIRVILQELMQQWLETMDADVNGARLASNWSTNPYTYSHRAVVNVNTWVRLAQRLRLVHVTTSIEHDADGAHSAADAKDRETNGRDGAGVQEICALQTERKMLFRVGSVIRYDKAFSCHPPGWPTPRRKCCPRPNYNRTRWASKQRIGSADSSYRWRS